MKCAEVDNCKLKPFPCSQNANCQKTGAGTHKCVCKPGYKGDGLTCRYDTTEIDHHDTNMRDTMGRIDDLVPKVNRVIFDGHDRIQNDAVGTMHDSLSRVDKHVEQLANNAARTGASLKSIAKAMKAVHDNTIEQHVIHDGPAPLGNPGTTDPASALKKVGDIADQRDRGVGRMPAN
jgi:uncharacterized protein YukE